MSTPKCLLITSCLCIPALWSPSAQAGFVDCSNTQQAVLQNATFNAHLWLGKAISDIGTPLPNPNYSKWFGSWTSTRGQKVKMSLGNLKAHMTIGNITYHCKCPAALDAKGVIAAVHDPGNGIQEKPYHVYLCKNFFSLSDTGQDSKGGTLIHEITHFDVVNSTRDFCYGVSQCQQKAANAPDDAIKSADNYQYYCEDLQ